LNTKLKCLLLDDELPGLTYLKMLCDQIPELEIIKVFDDPTVFINESSLLNFDLCILDIEMPGIDGIQIAKVLEGKSIIFVTAYKEYAAEAFDLNAVDYILKPIKIERLKQAVQKTLLNISIRKPKKDYVQLNTDKGKALLYYNQIAYIITSDIDSRDKVAYMYNGSKAILKNISFDQLLFSFPNDQFCRINKKVLLSLKSIQYYSQKEITTNILLPTGKYEVFILSLAYYHNFIRMVKF
jgi:DNA-binding LytR/AlgR family response regulator